MDVAEVASLKALGGLDLSAGGSELSRVLQQPKRLGLLVFLACAPANGYRRRDTLLGYFWPELDQERARGALRQALYMLRRELGEEVLRSRGDDEVGVDLSRLRFDVVEFREAVAAGQPQVAMELYRGDFLDGFFVGGVAPEFDAWMAAERERLRQLAAGAAWSLAESGASRGESGAIRWIRRAMTLAPDDETGLRRGLSLLERLGDRAGALQVYHEFRDRLAREYEASPSPETEAAAAALRKPNDVAPVGVTTPVTGPEISQAPEPGPVPERERSRTVAPSRRALPWFGMTGFAGLAMILVLAFVRAPGSSREPLDPDLIVALPFRITADAGSTYLREGFLDLLDVKLASGTGPHLVDPARVLPAWRRAGGGPGVDLPRADALRLARALGASRLLLGSVVGNADGLTAQALVVRVQDGSEDRPVVVTGRRDSVAAMVDRFAASLLLSTTGEVEQNLGDLTSRSLPALQAYLAGKHSLRAGAYDSAGTQLARALDLDSTFALAGLTLAVWQPQLGGGFFNRARHGLDQAMTWKARLAPRDRAFLRFVAGPGYPDRAATLQEQITNWEDAANRFPERVEVWFYLGDNLFHWGLQLGIDDAPQRAARAFDRALALDPFLAPALEHRLWLAARDRDTQALRRLGPLYLSTHPAAERLVAHEWRLAMATGDSATVRSIRSSFDTLTRYALGSIHRSTQEEFPSAADAESTIVRLKRQSSTSGELYFNLIMEHDLALNRGQARRAAAIIDSARKVETAAWTDSEGRVLVYDVLYQEGDSLRGATAAQLLAARAGRPLPAEKQERGRRYYDLCAAAQWKLAHSDAGYAKVAATRLARTREPEDEGGDVAEHHLCAAILEMRLALAEGREPGPPARALDSVLVRGPWVYALVRQAAFLALAEGYERSGDPGRALAVIRRQDLNRWNRMMTTRLREEGRLATVVGDTAGAIRAYAGYLALRDRPDPSVAADVDRVRKARGLLSARP